MPSVSTPFNPLMPAEIVQSDDGVKQVEKKVTRFIVSFSLTRIKRGHRPLQILYSNSNPPTAAVSERCDCSSVFFYLLIVQSKYRARYHGECDYCCLNIHQCKIQSWTESYLPTFLDCDPLQRKWCIVWAPFHVSDVCRQQFHYRDTFPLTCFPLKLNYLLKLLPAQRGPMIQYYTFSHL